MPTFLRRLLPLGLIAPGCLLLAGQVPAEATAALVIAEKGKAHARIVISPEAGLWEKRAADDLAHFIDLMVGAKPAIASTPDAITAALKGTAPLLVVGSAALAADPSLRTALERVAKKNPVLRADAIVLRRSGNRVYLAGSNDDSHYYAVAELLHRWGCRWYMPTAFGQCVPEMARLTVDNLDHAYAPPFEVRNFWIAWNGSYNDFQEFSRRNRMNPGVGVPSGHAIGKYVKELIPKGKTLFDVPIAEDATADHIAKKISPLFAAGKDISLGMEDGIYRSESRLDRELRANLQDKYFLVPSLTDPFLVLYNKVANRLLREHPKSKSHIGFLAYSNITLPPQRDISAAKPLVAYLAPIDIDPIHGMDDPKSPPRQEYREMLYRWAKVMEGRVVIYDYDQGMLVWRDVPCPSIQSIRQDVKHYRKAGILGVSTESRGATATVFLNLFVRGQLFWNPDADVDALLAEFYEKFYGPAARPMAAYWTAIHNAWASTIVTEHEHFLLPAVYTPELLARLRKHLETAEKLVEPLKGKKDPGRNEKLYLERMQFTHLSFEILDAYVAMVQAAATGADYKTAVAAGQRGLAARKQLAGMNPTFTTRVVGVAAETEKTGPAWWSGEVKQYRDLLAFTDGSKGKLLLRTPLEWAFRRDPHDTGVVSGWAYRPVDLTWWHARKDKWSIASHQHNPGYWEMLRTDLYMQAQGVISPDHHGYTGHAWYRTEIELPADAAQGKVHLRFPGLFNECWLYVNGYLVGHREQNPIWWYNDYKFEWDVDLTGKLKPGKNTLTLRLHNPHHFGGIFRRPFLYRPTGG
jgi:Domain of unknown function (DUF4838)/Glycosyl hydrolases family 2, sugar binding domain